MANLNGGYVMINLADTSNLYNLALKAIDANKPIMVYGDDIPYIADSVTADGSSVTITKGGQIIEVASDNTITKTGDKDGALLSSIVDANGNARFVEGNLEVVDTTGVTFTYSKWSLCGTHLMIVLAGNVADTTTLSNGATLANVSLSSWILDKIYPVWSVNVARKDVSLTAEDWSTQTAIMILVKDTNKLKIIQAGNVTLTDDRAFRVQFDLLIDTE